MIYWEREQQIHINTANNNIKYKNMYSINRDTEVSSLNEKLLIDRSDTLLTQKSQRGKKDTLLRQTTSVANRAAITDPLQKSTKFNDLTDIRTVLDNFMSQPMQFKFNKDQTRVFVMSQEQTTVRNKPVIQTKIEVYSLPEFKIIQASDLQDIDLNTFGQSSGYKYLDVSEDERFMLYGHEGKLIVQSTNSLFPAAYPAKVNAPYQSRELSLPDLGFPTTCGARFTENNEVAFVYFFNKDNLRQIIVKQTRSAALEILNGDVLNESMGSSIIGGGQPNEFQIHKAIDVKTAFSGQQNQFNIILFNSCFYIRFFDGLYIYRSEVSSQQMSNNFQQNQQQQATFWDPLKGQQILPSNQGLAGKLGQSIMGSAMGGVQIQQQNSDPYNNIVQCFVQEGVLLIQQAQGLIVMYQQKMGLIKGCIVEQKRLNLEQFYPKGEDMVAIKLYQGNLYLKNDSISKLDVLTFRDGQLKKLWSYQYDQNYMMDSHFQFQTSHYIHILEKENQKVLRQINGYKNELLFSQVWPNLRPKFTMVANDQLFQDGENDGSLLIVDKNGRQFVKPVSVKDTKSAINLNRFKNIVKNIYYSEELAQLVLIKSFEASANKIEQIFFMSTEGPNYEVRELSKEIADQNFTIIGTMFKSKKNQDVVLLFALVESQNLVVFELQNESKDRKTFKTNKTKEMKELDNKEYRTISDIENTRKEDIYILKESKLIIVKINDTDQYQILFDFVEDSKVDADVKNVIKDKGRLLQVANNKLYFLNQTDKTLSYYEIKPEQKTFEGPKAMDPQIKPANFQILWDAADKPKSNQREVEEKNERFIYTDNFLVCQNQSKICIFDAKTFDLKCQINNVPLGCGFLRTQDKQFYLLVKSSIDGLIDVKRFNLFNDKELLSLNEKEELRTFKESKAVEAPDEETKELLNKQHSDQANDLPIEFQLSLDTFITFDYFEPRVDLFDSADAGNLKVWTNLYSRSIISKNLLGNPNKKVILDYFMKKAVDNSSPYNFQECLFFDTLHKKSVLHLVIENSQIFTAIIDRLLTMKEDELPYLMFEDESGRTPLDIAIQSQQVKNVVSLLRLIVYHKSAAEQYNQHIDKHLTTLISMELNLKDLFESEILYHSVPGYQPQESNKSDFLYPTVYEFQDDIYKGYDLIVNDSNSLLLKEAQQDDEEEEPAEEGQVVQQKQFSVDYNLIDMKHSITYMGFNSNKPTLMEVLEKQTRQDIFEFPCIQRIIDYKWLTYTQAFFQVQFYWFLALCLMFYLSLFVQQTILEEGLQKETLVIAGIDFGEIQLGTTMMANLVLTVGCAIIALKFLIHELKSMFNSKFTEYITDFWNVNDLLLFTLLPLQGFLNVSQIVEVQSTYMKLVKCLIILLFFVKLNFFLRIFDTFSFLVSMLQDVFSDLSAFLAFFMMAVAIFSCLIQVLLPETKVNYDGAGFFSYLMMAFRTSIGDYTFDNYKASTMKEVTWIVWLALMIIGNVVFMNFIIAVVNDSYSTSMAKKVSQSYRLKVPLIIEREKLFREQQDVKDIAIKRRKEMEAEAARIASLSQKGANPKDQENNGQCLMTNMTIYVPNYIVVRTSSTAGDTVDDPMIFQNQIQNSIQEIQRTQEEQADEIKQFKVQLKNQVDQIRDLLIQANVIRPSNPAAAIEDGNGQMPNIRATAVRRQ